MGLDPKWLLNEENATRVMRDLHANGWPMMIYNPAHHGIFIEFEDSQLHFYHLPVDGFSVNLSYRHREVLSYSLGETRMNRIALQWGFLKFSTAFGRKPKDIVEHASFLRSDIEFMFPKIVTEGKALDLCKCLETAESRWHALVAHRRSR